MTAEGTAQGLEPTADDANEREPKPDQNEPKPDQNEPKPDQNKPVGYVDDVGEQGAPGAAGGAENLAANFLRHAYLLRLHKFASDPEEHPTREKWCFIGDYVLRVLAALILLGIAVVAAWKALTPLPWEHTHTTVIVPAQTAAPH